MQLSIYAFAIKVARTTATITILRINKDNRGKMTLLFPFINLLGCISYILHISLLFFFVFSKKCKRIKAQHFGDRDDVNFECKILKQY